jgi:uncharacterized membrane protein YdjX (TVP38/TMEM64 family)
MAGERGTKRQRASNPSRSARRAFLTHATIKPPLSHPHKPQSGRPRHGPRRAACLALTRSTARFIWAHWDKALVAAGLGTVIGLAASHSGQAKLVALLAWFQKRNGWAGWGIFLGVYTAVVALLLPAVWLVLGAGFVFGFWRGLLAVWVGGAVGQAAAFLLARYLLGGCVAGALRGRSRSVWEALDRAMALDGWKLLALLRLCPLVPYNLLNIASAATAIPFWAFALTSAVAIGPECALFTYTGSVAEGITEIVSGGSAHRPHGAGRWVGFGLTAVAAAGTSILATLFVRRAIARADAHTAALAAAEAEAADVGTGGGGLDPLAPEGVFAPPPLVLGGSGSGGGGGRLNGGGWARLSDQQDGGGSDWDGSRRV